MDNLITTLQDGAKEIGIELSTIQLEQFQMYYHYLIEENKKINLTSIVDPQEVAIKHFIDSITCLTETGIKPPFNILDIGSGAGFPGIVLKILYPEILLTLIDSLQKRIEFLNNLALRIKLNDVKALHGRAEEFGQNINHREKYTYVVSRAVANLAVLAEFCLPLTQVGGSFIAMKGSKAQEEIKSAENAINILGGKIEEIHILKLPILGDERTILKINKVSPTPEKYPRRPGIPVKKPLT